MKKINIECENTYSNWDLNIDVISKKTRDLYNYLTSVSDIKNNCLLKNYKYNEIFFDILFCDGERTHQINKEYRNKDYPADIITFAVFADSQEDERFILDGVINLGEIIIALDKIEESAKEKGITRESELFFFIAHGIMHLLGFDHQTEQEYNFVVKYQKKQKRGIYHERRNLLSRSRRRYRTRPSP